MKKIFKDKLNDGRTVSLEEYSTTIDSPLNYFLLVGLDRHYFNGDGSKERAWSFISNLFPGRVFYDSGFTFISTKTHESRAKSCLRQLTT